MEKDTITIEQDGYEVEIPKLEAQMLLREFVEELVEDLDKEAKKQGEKANQIGQIIKGSELLNDEEMTELLGENREHGGRAEAQRETGTFIWKKLNEFVDDL